MHLTSSSDPIKVFLAEEGTKMEDVTYIKYDHSEKEVSVYCFVLYGILFVIYCCYILRPQD